MPGERPGPVPENVRASLGGEPTQRRSFGEAVRGGVDRLRDEAATARGYGGLALGITELGVNQLFTRRAGRGRGGRGGGTEGRGAAAQDHSVSDYKQARGS